MSTLKCILLNVGRSKAQQTEILNKYKYDIITITEPNCSEGNKLTGLTKHFNATFGKNVTILTNKKLKTEIIKVTEHVY